MTTFGQRSLSIVGLVLACLGLSGCENDAASYQIDGKDHALVLIREQKFFWDDGVDQALVVNRMPDCQRRSFLKKGTAGALKMEVYEMRPGIYALRQGKQWYLANTSDCEVNKADAPTSGVPGKLLGAFMYREEKLRFVPVDQIGSKSAKSKE